MSTLDTAPAQAPIIQLRQHLLDTLKDLRNREQPMEPDRARAVALVASGMIDVAKVTIDYMKLADKQHSDFFENTVIEEEHHLSRITHAEPTANRPFPTTVHRLQG